LLKQSLHPKAKALCFTA